MRTSEQRGWYSLIVASLTGVEANGDPEFEIFYVLVKMLFVLAAIYFFTREE